MLCLPQLEAVFLHIPRTGGTWVKHVLEASGIETVCAGGPGDHNLPGAIYPHYRRYKRFCFVRHPLAWYESIWRGLHTSWPDRRPVAALHRERSWSPIRLLTYTAGANSFAEFIETVMSEQPGFVSRMYEWYCGAPGNPLVDFVGRTEFVCRDLAAILGALGWSGVLTNTGRVNESESPRPEWPSHLEARVLAAEEAGCGRWYNPDTESPFRVTTE